MRTSVPTRPSTINVGTVFKSTSRTSASRRPKKRRNSYSRKTHPQRWAPGQGRAPCAFRDPRAAAENILGNPPSGILEATVRMRGERPVPRTSDGERRFAFQGTKGRRGRRCNSAIQLARVPRRTGFRLKVTTSFLAGISGAPRFCLILSQHHTGLSYASPFRLRNPGIEKPGPSEMMAPGFSFCAERRLSLLAAFRLWAAALCESIGNAHRFRCTPGQQ